MSKVKNKDKVIASTTKIDAQASMRPLAAEGSTIGFLFDTLKMSKEQIEKTIVLCRAKNYKSFVDPTVLDKDGNTLIHSKIWALNPVAQAQHFINLVENQNIQVIWSMHGSGGANLLVKEVERIINSPSFGFDRLAKFQNFMATKVFMGAFSHHSYMAIWGEDKFKAVINSTQIYHLAEFFEDASRIVENREATQKEKIAKSLVHNIDGAFEVLSSAQRTEHKIENYNAESKSTPLLKARITGGNLGVLAAELPNCKFRNRIILIEEAFYNDMHAFHRAFECVIDKAVKEGAVGILLGPIRGKDQEKINYAVAEIIERKCKDIPVYKTENFGHVEDIICQ